ncbi:MAG: spermidine synthase [Thermoanaerobaculia bacterium]
MRARELIRLELAVFLAGAALMSLEIVGARVLAPVFGSSVFVWGSIITVFLASLAVGAALGGRLADARPRPSVLANLLAASGVLTWVVFLAPVPVMRFFADASVPDRFRSLLAAIALFAAPCTLMGMITTFAVRLAAREIATLGAAAGRLSAISTAGSIAGTFATTFFLIPDFPTLLILFGIGLLLVLSAWIVPAPFSAWRLGRDAALTGAAVVAHLLVPAAVRAPAPAGTVVYEKETAYHRIRVVDQGLRRVLYSDRFTQGFAPVRPGLALPPNYTDGLLLGLAFSQKAPRSVVVIGLGAGMIPSRLSARSPEVSVTSIEIDPEIVSVARRYFGFMPGPRDRVLVGDGRHELEREVRQTDVIFVDAYFSDSVPFHLLTREFYMLCRDRLSADGVVAANFVGTMTGAGNALFWGAVKTLAEVFPRVYVFSPELSRGKRDFVGNAILVGSRSSDRLDRMTLAERARVLSEKLDRPVIATWTSDLYDGEIRTADVPILTDDYSPTDALQHFRR